MIVAAARGSRLLVAALRGFVFLGTKMNWLLVLDWYWFGIEIPLPSSAKVKQYKINKKSQVCSAERKNSHRCVRLSKTQLVWVIR